MANIQVNIREDGGVLVSDLSAVKIAAGDTLTFKAPSGTGVRLCVSAETAAMLGIVEGAEIPKKGSISFVVGNTASSNYEIFLEFPDKPGPLMKTADTSTILHIQSSSGAAPVAKPVTATSPVVESFSVAPPSGQGSQAAAAKMARIPIPQTSGKLITFNGVNGDTGDYFQEPLSMEILARMALGEKIDEDHLAELRFRREREKKKHLGLIEGKDPKKLEESGWGVIFTKNTPAAVKDALQPLLDFRKEQATKISEKRYQEYVYRPNETKPDFLERNKVGSGVVDPDKAPYYMLLVGSPEEIPFRFQYQLDVQFAVGRIHFDSPEEYANYAHSVIAAESGEPRLPKRAGFFATANPDDAATLTSMNELSLPLSQFVSTDQKAWTVESVAGEQATKTRLATLLGGESTPAFLFTASHGMTWSNGHPSQRATTGALVCQEWPGPDVKVPVVPDFYFAGDDLASDAKLHGLIAMFFACYGAGIPAVNEFASMDGIDPGRKIAPAPFISRLPQRMLGRKNGALAVIGHVERAWGYSFQTNRGDPQLQTFQSSLKRLLEGHPVGSAMESFNSRYAEISQDLTSEIDSVTQDNKKPNPFVLSSLWTSNHDARNYAVIGDPAVRLMV